MNSLLIEDEQKIADFVLEGFRALAWVCTHAFTQTQLWDDPLNPVCQRLKPLCAKPESRAASGLFQS
jgi:hypothetical protein